MSQTVYNLAQGGSLVGVPRSTQLSRVNSYRSDGVIPFGRGVVLSAATDRGGAELPSGVGRSFEGFAVFENRHQNLVADGTNPFGAVPTNSPIGVMSVGEIMVSPISAVTKTSVPHLRLTGPDAGRLSAGPAVAGVDFPLTGCRFVDEGAANSVVGLWVNLGSPLLTA